VRDDVSSDRRLRYPVKLVGGAWQWISWDQAIDEIGNKLLEIRAKSGPESVYWLGSAKFTNVADYLSQASRLLGTNNADSTTVAGVANTWGYGQSVSNASRNG
jgi:formate dehydrogenase major subunit